MASQVRVVHLTFKDTKSFFAYRTSHTAFLSHFTLDCSSSRCLPRRVHVFHFARLRDKDEPNTRQTQALSARYELETQDASASHKIEPLSSPVFQENAIKEVPSYAGY